MEQETAFITRFFVIGDGEFPIDMLRYDRCFPATEEDTWEITRSFRDPLAKRRIELIRVGRNPVGPTVERWQGKFLWKVFLEEE